MWISDTIGGKEACLFVSFKKSRRSPIISRNQPELFVFYLGGGTLEKEQLVS